MTEPMPPKKPKHKVWVWLTPQQIDAVLAVAAMIDAKPESLDAILPAQGDRAAFRAAITAMQTVKSAMRETSQGEVKH